MTLLVSQGFPGWCVALFPMFAWGCMGLPGWFFHICLLDRGGVLSFLDNAHIELTHSKRGFPYNKAWMEDLKEISSVGKMNGQTCEHVWEEEIVRLVRLSRRVCHLGWVSYSKTHFVAISNSNWATKVTFPSVDRVEWLNSLIDKVWPHFGRWLQQGGRINNILLLSFSKWMPKTL